jgi:hypothetical protein
MIPENVIESMRRVLGAAETEAASLHDIGEHEHAEELEAAIEAARNYIERSES